MVSFKIYFIFSPKGKFKPFRITKKGIDTGVFEKIPISMNSQGNNNMNLNINNNIQNNQNAGSHTIRINLDRRSVSESNQIDIDNN